MASKIGMTYRDEAARKRVNTVVPALAERLGVEVPPLPTVRRDRVLQDTLRLEWMADLLDAVHAAMDAPAKSTTKTKGKG